MKLLFLFKRLAGVEGKKWNEFPQMGKETIHNCLLNYLELHNFKENSIHSAGEKFPENGLQQESKNLED